MKSLIRRLYSSLLIGCCSLPAYADFHDISRIYRQMPQINHFEVCRGGGCAASDVLAFSVAEWARVGEIFATPAANAAAERAQISQAIGLMEQLVGAKNGTSADRAGTFDNSDYPGQMDCNDEAINTTTYMRLLKQSGYIRFHEVQDTRTRNFFFTGWPHTTAVLKETKTAAEFAVDSWFYDNGHAATVVSMEQWKDNYQPADSPVGKSRDIKTVQTKP